MEIELSVRNLVKVAPVLFLLMWSSGAIFVKLGLENGSVWSFLALRACGALLVITVASSVLLPREIRETLSVSKSLIVKSMVAGLLLQVAYQSFFFLAIDHDLAPGTLAIILGLQPILTPIFAREIIGIRGYLSLAVGFAGLSLVVYGAKDVSAMSVSGVLFAFASVLAITMGSVYQKHLNIHPIASAIYQYTAASIVFLIIIAFQGWNVVWTAQFAFCVAWMVCVVSVGAVLLLFHMLSNEAASKVGVLFYLVPIFTMAFDYVVFGTVVTGFTIIGVLIVISAILMFQRSQNRRGHEVV